MNVREILNAEIARVEQGLADMKAQAEALPAEVHALSEEAWTAIKKLFTGK